MDGCLTPDTSCVYKAISGNVETNNRFVREMFAEEMERVSNDPDKTYLFQNKISGEQTLGALYTTNVGPFGYITGEYTQFRLPILIITIMPKCAKGYSV